MLAELRIAASFCQLQLLLPDMHLLQALWLLCYRPQCPTEPGSDELGASFAETHISFHSRWEEGTYLVGSGPGLPSFLEIASNIWEAAMGQGRLPAHPRLRAEGQHGHPLFTTDSLLFFFLSIPCEVKSLPGIPPSPAPAIATFNQAPSQPQASQTLTPLAVQAAPQVRTTPGSWTEGSGQERAWSCMRHGAVA